MFIKLIKMCYYCHLDCKLIVYWIYYHGATTIPFHLTFKLYSILMNHNKYQSHTSTVININLLLSFIWIGLLRILWMLSISTLFDRQLKFLKFIWTYRLLRNFRQYALNDLQKYREIDRTMFD